MLKYRNCAQSIKSLQSLQTRRKKDADASASAANQPRTAEGVAASETGSEEEEFREARAGLHFSKVS